MLSVLYCEGSFISSHSEYLPKTMYVEREGEGVRIKDIWESYLSIQSIEIMIFF